MSSNNRTGESSLKPSAVASSRRQRALPTMHHRSPSASAPAPAAAAASSQPSSSSASPETAAKKPPPAAPASSPAHPAPAAARAPDVASLSSTLAPSTATKAKKASSSHRRRVPANNNSIVSDDNMFPSFPHMLYDLMAFRCREGHCRVPIDYHSGNNHQKALGSWVALLRRCYRERLKQGHQVDYLNQERVDILNSIDFDWTAAQRSSKQQHSSDQRWEANYTLLQEYCKEHGHCNVPQSTKLGKWVQMQRDQYREKEKVQNGHAKKRSLIPDDRIAKLNALGFAWSVVKRPEGWEKRFQELLSYRALMGHCNVPQLWKENIRLGRWVMKQRVQYHKKMRGEKSFMNDDRIQRLEEIGFEWVAPGASKKKKEQEPANLEEEEVEEEEAEVEASDYHHQQQNQHPQYYHHHHRQPPPPDNMQHGYSQTFSQWM